MDKVTSYSQLVAGIEKARSIAQERGKALTLERVAACVGLDHRELARYPFNEITDEEEREAAVEAVKKVVLECRADLADNLLTQGNNGGSIFLAVNNHGYKNTNDSSVNVTVRVPVFGGEDKLED